ncbi:MAG: cell division protein ZapA [Eubacteriales bacterium]|nr:cell division protein ZapA [Eubacteriales bacterium]
MPGYNSFEVNIGGKKYKLQTDENQDYVKKIESLINTKINQYKTADKKFDNYSSLIFTTFVIADKYLKVLHQLEIEKKLNQEVMSLSEVKKIKDEHSQFKIDLEHTVQEKDQYLQELIQKNSDLNILTNKLNEYEKLLKEYEEQAAQEQQMKQDEQVAQVQQVIQQQPSEQEQPSDHQEEQHAEQAGISTTEIKALKNRLLAYEILLKEKEEELTVYEELNRELEQKNKKMSHDVFLLREEIELRD